MGHHILVHVAGMEPVHMGQGNGMVLELEDGKQVLGDMGLGRGGMAQHGVGVVPVHGMAQHDVGAGLSGQHCRPSPHIHRFHTARGHLASLCVVFAPRAHPPGRELAGYVLGLMKRQLLAGLPAPEEASGAVGPRSAPHYGTRRRTP